MDFPDWSRIAASSSEFHGLARANFCFHLGNILRDVFGACRLEQWCCIDAIGQTRHGVMRMSGREMLWVTLCSGRTEDAKNFPASRAVMTTALPKVTSKAAFPPVLRGANGDQSVASPRNVG